MTMTEEKQENCILFMKKIFPDAILKEEHMGMKLYFFTNKIYIIQLTVPEISNFGPLFKLATNKTDKFQVIYITS